MPRTRARLTCVALVIRFTPRHVALLSGNGLLAGGFVLGGGVVAPYGLGSGVRNVAYGLHVGCGAGWEGGRDETGVGYREKGYEGLSQEAREGYHNGKWGASGRLDSHAIETEEETLGYKDGYGGSRTAKRSGRVPVLGCRFIWILPWSREGRIGRVGVGGGGGGGGCWGREGRGDVFSTRVTSERTREPVDCVTKALQGRVCGHVVTQAYVFQLVLAQHSTAQYRHSTPSTGTVQHRLTGLMRRRRRRRRRRRHGRWA